MGDRYKAKEGIWRDDFDPVSMLLVYTTQAEYLRDRDVAAAYVAGGLLMFLEPKERTRP